MEQKKILLKSFDVQPFTNQDEYIDFELTSTSKEMRDSYISNDFDIDLEYENERNNSRKFFLYGRLYGKQTDTDGLIVTLTTSNNDTLYVPNKQNNVLPAGTKSFSVLSKPLVKNTSLSKNIFNKIECGYFFQFEIENSTSGITNLANIRVSGKDIDNIVSTPIVLFDADGEFLPYGTIDTILDQDFNLSEIDNDFPFLYDYHWIKQDVDVVTFNNMFFPYKIFQDSFGNSIIDSSTQITDENKNPSFQLLMDYPSFYGLEKATLNVVKAIRPRDGYVLPINLFNQQKFEDYSPWKGFPSNQFEWNVFGGALSKIRDTIINNQNLYSNINIFNTPQQFYDANHRFYLSFLKGGDLDVQRGEVINDDFIIKGFLDYSISPYKKDVDSTLDGEFISGFSRDTGKIIQKVDVSFNIGENSHNYNIDLSAVTFFNKSDFLQVNFDSVTDALIGIPNSYLINVIAENKNPTAFFEENFESAEAINQDFEIVVSLDKTYQGFNPVTLSLSVIADKTTAVSLTQAKEEDASYPYGIEFTGDGGIKHNYEVLIKDVVVNKGDNKATFKVRIYYSNAYFLNKTITFQLNSSSSDILVDDFNNNFTMDIYSNVVKGWTKYQFVSDELIGLGIFRSKRLVSDSNAKFNFELDSPLTFLNARNNFTPNFKYTIACINAGDVNIPYGGEYGGEEKDVLPGETLFEVNTENQFDDFNFVLPSNASLTESFDINNVKRARYYNARYEFKIKNIEPVDINDSSAASVFNEVSIPAQKLFSFIATTKEDQDLWKTAINKLDFFDKETVIDFTNIDLASNGGFASEIAKQNAKIYAEKSVFALRTGIQNTYAPKASDKYITSISQIIDPNNTNKTLLQKTSIFGTILLNSAVDGNSTNITYRAFTNNRDKKKLLVPAQTSINAIQSDEDAAYFSKFFYFTYQEFGIKYSNDPNVDNTAPFNFAALKLIHFNPSLVAGVNSFNDNVPGLKPLPVYEYVEQTDLIIE